MGEVDSWEKERENRQSMMDKKLHNHMGSTFATTMTHCVKPQAGRGALCFSLGSPEEMSKMEKLETRNINMLLKKKC